MLWLQSVDVPFSEVDTGTEGQPHLDEVQYGRLDLSDCAHLGQQIRVRQTLPCPLFHVCVFSDL